MSALNIEDPTHLRAYLENHGYTLLESSVLPGGVSNRTVLARLTDGSSIVVKQAKERLTSSSEWLSDPRRIRQEALAMQWLSRWTPRDSIPDLVFLDMENNILAMSAVPQPHKDWKTLLLSRQICHSHFARFGELLASIHSGGYLGRTEIEPLFRDQSFFFSLRVDAYYIYTARNVPAAAQFLHELVAEMDARRFTLITAQRMSW